MSKHFSIIAIVTFTFTATFGIAYYNKLLPFQKDYYSANDALKTEGQTACKNNGGAIDIASVNYINRNKFMVFCGDGTVKWISSNKPANK